LGANQTQDDNTTEVLTEQNFEKGIFLYFKNNLKVKVFFFGEKPANFFFLVMA
jgi:hypothetical protein